MSSVRPANSRARAASKAVVAAGGSGIGLACSTGNSF
jgi:hypothetical protein